MTATDRILARLRERAAGHAAEAEKATNAGLGEAATTSKERRWETLAAIRIVEEEAKRDG